MKYYNIKALLACLLVALFTSCEDDLPKNPTIVSPISALEMTVNGIDYTAVPKLLDSGALNDTLFLTVRIPNTTATVKAVHFDKGFTGNIKPGDVVTFDKDVFPISLNKGGDSYTYVIKMDYKEPPILYFVKSSDRDTDGNKYYLDKNKSQRLASLNSDNKYEGFIDLTETNWDNIGLVASDLKSTYEYDGGWWPAKSSGSFTMVKKSASGTSNYFPSAGPWGDWLWTNDNPKIVSPGVWRFDFNVSSGELIMTETQWAVSGTAIGASTAMVYSTNKKEWSVTANLNVGTLRFVTIPVVDGDPTLSYGELGSSTVTGYIESQGKDIEIKEAGNYTISIDLSKPPYYSYSIIKK